MMAPLFCWFNQLTERDHQSYFCDMDIIVNKLASDKLKHLAMDENDIEGILRGVLKAISAGFFENIRQDYFPFTAHDSYCLALLQIWHVPCGNRALTEDNWTLSNRAIKEMVAGKTKEYWDSSMGNLEMISAVCQFICEDEIPTTAAWLRYLKEKTKAMMTDFLRIFGIVFECREKFYKAGGVPKLAPPVKVEPEQVSTPVPAPVPAPVPVPVPAPVMNPFNFMQPKLEPPQFFNMMPPPPPRSGFYFQ